MSRTITLTLGERVFEAPTTFKALQEVDRKIGCPMAIINRGGNTPATQMEALNVVALAMLLAGLKETKGKALAQVAGELYDAYKDAPQVYYSQGVRYLVAFFGDPDAKPAAPEEAEVADVPAV